MIDEALKLHDQGELNRAAEAYRQLLAEDPKHTDALHFLGLIHLQRGQLDDAENLLQQALETAPEADAILASLGDLMLQRGDVERASKHLDRACELNPNNADALTGVGLCQLRTGKGKAARDAFDRALLARDDHPVANTHRGLMYLQDGDDQTAEALIRKALKTDPGFALGLMALAEVLKSRNAWGLALATVEKALEREPGNFRARLLRAECLILNNRVGEAEPELRQLKAERGQDAELLRVLGDLARRSGRPADALRLYQHALGNTHQHAPLAERLAEVYGELGQWPQAQAIWQQFSEQQPQVARWKIALASTLARQDKRAEARAALPQASSLNGEDRLASLRLGAELAMLDGEFEQADALLQQIPQDNADAAVATLRAGLALRKQADAEAEQLASQALQQSRPDSLIQQLTARRLLALSLDRQQRYREVAKLLFRPGSTAPLGMTERLLRQATRMRAAQATPVPVGEPPVVFLVGFSGSGLETMAKALSQVDGVSVLADRLGRDSRNDLLQRLPAGETADRANPDAIDIAVRKYWKAVRRLAGEDKQVIDVLPIGRANPEQIARHFPGARLIMLGRSAGDVVLQSALWGYLGEDSTAQVLGLSEALLASHRAADGQLPLDYHWVDFDALVAQPHGLGSLLEELGLQSSPPVSQAFESGLCDEFGLAAYWPAHHSDHYLDAMRSGETP